MQAMRDLTRNLSGEGRAGVAAAPHAGLDEVCSALAKRLKAFPPTPEASADEPPTPGASADASFETGFDRLTPPQDEQGADELPAEDEGGSDGDES